MNDDPTSYRKFKLVADLQVMDAETFDGSSPEQITLYLARAGVSPLDTQASLQRALELIQAYEEREALRELRELEKSTRETE